MKLYIWYAHPDRIFGAMAETMGDAFVIVDSYIKETYGEFHPAHDGKDEIVGSARIILPPQPASWSYSDGENGWPSDYFVLEYEIGEPIQIPPKDFWNNFVMGGDDAKSDCRVD